MEIWSLRLCYCIYSFEERIKGIAFICFAACILEICILLRESQCLLLSTVTTALPSRLVYWLLWFI